MRQIEGNTTEETHLFKYFFFLNTIMDTSRGYFVKNVENILPHTYMDML